MEIEIRELERKYEGLRITDPARIARLTASIQQYGQQTPVLVVPQAAGGYVLIDGYARVAAVQSLARDLIEALVLPLSEAEALIQSHRLEASRRRTALEDGWLLRELVEVQGRRQSEVALALQRSVSWVNRRLALVRVLSESVQGAVRRAQIPAQAAMRVLVPLSRAKAGHGEQLVENLKGRKVSVRQMDAIYRAYRQTDEEGRQHLVDHPWLFFKVREETPPAETMEPADASRLAHDLEALSGSLRRVRRQLRAGVYRRAAVRQQQTMDSLWVECETTFAALTHHMNEESFHAGSRPALGDSPPAPAGAGGAQHRPSSGDLEELGQARPA